MFTTEELQAIDRKYFTVIVSDAYDVNITCWRSFGGAFFVFTNN